ncbi:MAG: helix-turn-helix transcriptional regulator [Oscillospiraceae bacterium]
MKNTELAHKVGARIRLFRLRKKLSQEALALEAEINPAFLGHLERGLKCPTVDTLFKITTALKITLSDLLDFESDSAAAHSESLKRIEIALRGMTEVQAQKTAEIIETIAGMSASRQSGESTVKADG